MLSLVIKKKLAISCLILSLGTLVGCGYTDENGNKINPAGEKLFGDRSEYMPTIEMSDTEFATQVKLSITPIVQDGLTLKSQAIAIMNGRANKSSELSKIDVMQENIQKTRNDIFNYNVTDSKQVSKDELIKALDTYGVELTNYRNLLEQDNAEKEKIQFSIDNVISALDLVKQYAK